MLTCLAPRAKEAVGEHPASKVLAELGLDVLREWRAVGLACVRDKRLEVLTHERVQHRLRRTARPIRAGEHGRHEHRQERASCQSRCCVVPQGSE